QTIAKGDVGMIIPGYMYVHPLGRAYKNPIGIHKDEMISGLKNLVDTVHKEGSKIFFQLNHAGRQTCKDDIGQTPMAPSDSGRDPVYFFKPKVMNEKEIEESINAFGTAARRAVETGVDGIQIHAAHGYLINQFLSPFFNLRKDAWGGSKKKRFRFLKKIIIEIKKNIPDNFPIIIKLNTCDHTPKEGITHSIAVKYAKWLNDYSIDMIELSCGTSVFSYMNMCRGEVPVKELVQSLPFWKKPLGSIMISSLKGKYDLKEGYNIEAAKLIKPVVGKIPLCVVGGMRSKKSMEDTITNGYADFISMSRPFIREPFIVKKFRENKKDTVSCVSCNKCLAAIPNGIPVMCYNKDFPKKQK
ncbi:MAG: NADH:flavin oxidoreductase, partial [Desulfobacula sp.]|nr:NADH:flavin oxidoreductase [Desulfobacula sp.]